MLDNDDDDDDDDDDDNDDDANFVHDPNVHLGRVH